MLKEISAGRQQIGDLTRRWFADESFDLFIFVDENGTLLQLQLSYDKTHQEHIISWAANSGYTHNRVDDGQDISGKARSPIMVPDGVCDIDRIISSFRNSSDALDDELFDAVYRKLIGFKHNIDF